MAKPHRGRRSGALLVALLALAALFSGAEAAKEGTGAYAGVGAMLRSEAGLSKDLAGALVDVMKTMQSVDPAEARSRGRLARTHTHRYCTARSSGSKTGLQRPW